MDKIEQIEKDIALIKARNVAVEGDKAWETSGLRKIIIILLTYVLVSLYMVILNVDKPFLNAIIPTLGYLLSTLTMTFIKKQWINSKNR